MAAVLLAAGCAGRRSARTQPLSGPPAAGTYRVRLEEPDGKSRKFKLLLFAGLPDRLHGEIVSPVGGTLLVFDGGGGRLAVTFVKDRTSFVGASRDEALEQLFGVHVSLERLVRALWLGEPVGADWRVDRDGPPAGMPVRFELSSHLRRMTLDLKKYQTLRGPAEAIGVGSPPPGTTVRPLEDLARHPTPIAETGK